MLDTSKELSKPTGQQHRGHGRGLHGQLQDSWCQKHEMQPLLPTPVATDGFFKQSSCCTLSFCHCSNSPSGQQAFHFHGKLVSLLRPYFSTERRAQGRGKRHLDLDLGSSLLYIRRNPKRSRHLHERLWQKAFLF